MSIAPRKPRALAVAAAVLSLFAAVAGCSRADRTTSGAEAPPANTAPAAEVRLGYFPNVTHASALIGLDKGLFGKELGATKLTPVQFSAGPEEVSALLGGSLDIGFIGSGPAINAFAKSGGETVRLVSGATSGGAQLVVAPQINSPQDLRGKTVAAPQFGNTQDVALKKWLADNQLGDVQVQNIENSQTLDQFRQGRLAGAWLPEPWASRLVHDAGAKVLLDEKQLWPEGKFPTTVVLVRTEFLKQHPQTVQAVLRGLLAANDLAAANPAEAKSAVNAQLKKLTGKDLSSEVIDRAFTGIELTADPLASRFPQLAQDQVTAGIERQAPDLKGLVDVTAINAVLEAAGKPKVADGGLSG
ncbi:ABC transporter substrate-binding protein [Saccharopolyspora spinosa]|uniref:ABC transporter substrate-binding protein n=1 Tax=Saccharopolyspora spinosa TaxID=60894 RepID=UPI0002378CCC